MWQPDESEAGKGQQQGLVLVLLSKTSWYG